MRTLAFAWGMILTLAGSVAAASQIPENIRAGEYMFRVSGCKACHTASTDSELAGGYRLVADGLGVFYTPNITPDEQTGIGKWSLKDFRRALRYGKSPTGMPYYPVFPYRSYTKLSNQDISNMWDYLQTVKPIRRQNRDHILNAPWDGRQNTGPALTALISTRTGLLAWQDLTAAVPWDSAETRIRTGFGPMKDDPSKSAEWNRGAYLVEAAFHCTECHTPRGPVVRTLKLNQWMSGANFLLDGHKVPNITPDKLTGLGAWTEADWTRFLESGIKPDLKTTKYEMLEVIQNAASLSPRDRASVVEYMMNLPAVRSTHEN